jgi:hypothetical protein
MERDQLDLDGLAIDRLLPAKHRETDVPFGVDQLAGAYMAIMDMNSERPGRTATRALFDAVDEGHGQNARIRCRVALRGSTSPLS